MSTTTPTNITSPSLQAIDEALRAALFYLHATNIPNAVALASILTQRAARLFAQACEKGGAA